MTPNLPIVLQCDRDAAVAYAKTRARDLFEDAGIVEIAFGVQDRHPLVQAFARHRTQAIAEERERAGQYHDKLAERHAAFQASAELAGSPTAAAAHERERLWHEAHGQRIRQETSV